MPNGNRRRSEEHLIDEFLANSFYWIGVAIGSTPGADPDLRPDRDLVFYAFRSYGGCGFRISFSPCHPARVKKFRHDPMVLSVRDFYSSPNNDIDGALRLQGLILDFYSGISVFSKIGVCDLALADRCEVIVESADLGWICDGCKSLTLKHKEPGFVYLAGDMDSGFFKIGCSRDPERRIKSAFALLPFEIDVVGKFFFADKYAGEKLCHRIFSNYAVRGEWFRIPAGAIDDVKQEIEELANKDRNQ